MNLQARPRARAVENQTEQQQLSIDPEMSIQEFIERFVDDAILSMEFLDDPPWEKRQPALESAK